MQNHYSNIAEGEKKEKIAIISYFSLEWVILGCTDVRFIEGNLLESAAARDGWGAGRSPFWGEQGSFFGEAGALGPDMAAVAVTAQPPPQGGPRRASGQHGGRERALAHAARRSRPCQTTPAACRFRKKTRGLFLIFENYY